MKQIVRIFLKTNRMYSYMCYLFIEELFVQLYIKMQAK